MDFFLSGSQVRIVGTINTVRDGEAIYKSPGPPGVLWVVRWGANEDN